jgi:beta-lactamase class A
MNQRSSGGLGQWILVLAMVVLVIFLLYKVYEYGAARSYLPAGLTVASVDVGGFTLDEAAQILTDRYITAPIVIYHLDNVVEISPTRAEFTLDLNMMLSEADYQRVQQDFWSGFWGYLLGQPVQVEMVPLHATHNRDALRRELNLIASTLDRPAQPPQPVPASLSFQYGASGTRTLVDASLSDVENALYRPFQREARLVVEPITPQRPDINLLARLITNHLDRFDGVASVFVMDLRTGEEVAINAGQPMSGMSVIKLPIVVESFRAIDLPLSLAQSRLISDTLVAQAGNESANELLRIIAGEDNPQRGAELVTESMRRLGLVNTFMAVPYDVQLRPGQSLQTPANSRADRATDPDPAMQTTAEEMGTLLSMLYYCAEDDGGALRAAYAGEITQQECQEIVDIMATNFIGSLLEEGVPADVPVAHRHGWVGDTHGDAGIVFSPGGDYVIVLFTHKQGWLEWEISAPLLADISRAAYNYFNFDNPYLSSR